MKEIFDIARDLKHQLEEDTRPMRARFNSEVSKAAEKIRTMAETPPSPGQPRRPVKEYRSTGFILMDILRDLGKTLFKDGGRLSRRAWYGMEDGVIALRRMPRKIRRMSPEKKLKRGMLIAAFAGASAFWVHARQDRMPDPENITAQDVRTYIKLQPERAKVFAMSDQEYLDNLSDNKKVIEISGAFSDAMKSYRGKVVLDDGTEIWTHQGQITRSDGPAVIYPDGEKVWMLNDGPWSEEQAKHVMPISPSAEQKESLLKAYEQIIKEKAAKRKAQPRR